MHRQKTYLFSIITFLSILLSTVIAEDRFYLHDQGKQEVLDATTREVNIDRVHVIGSNDKELPVFKLKLKPEISLTEEKISISTIATIGVALIALASNIWISWQNYLLLKRSKWQETWTAKINSLQESVYAVCIDSLSADKLVENFKIRLLISSAKSKFESLVEDNNDIVSILEAIEVLLCSSDSYQHKEDIFGLLTKFSSQVKEVMKNGK